MAKDFIFFKLWNLFIVTSGALIATGILGDSEVRAWILIGAIAGGMLAVIFNRPAAIAEMATKWIGSTAFAFIVTPYILAKAKPEDLIEAALCFSGILSFLAWIVLAALQEIAPDKVRKYLGKEPRKKPD